MRLHIKYHYYITITSHCHTHTQDSDTDSKYTLSKDTFVQAQKKQRKQTSRYTILILVNILLHRMQNQIWACNYASSSSVFWMYWVMVHLYTGVPLIEEAAPTLFPNQPGQLSLSEAHRLPWRQKLSILTLALVGRWRHSWMTILHNSRVQNHWPLRDIQSLMESSPIRNHSATSLWVPPHTTTRKAWL